MVAGKGLVNPQKSYATHQILRLDPDKIICILSLLCNCYFLFNLYLVAGKGLVNLQKSYATHHAEYIDHDTKRTYPTFTTPCP